MAIVKLNNNQTVTLSREKAEDIWAVLNGDIEGTKEQQEFCSKIKKIYLNRHHAPQSYLDKYATILKQMG